MEYSRLIYFRSSRTPTIDQVVRALSKDSDLRVSIDDKYQMLYKDDNITYHVGETILIDDGTFSMLVGMTSESHVAKEAEKLAQELLKRVPVNSPEEQVLAKLATCDARFEIGGAFPDDLKDLFEDHTEIFDRVDEHLESLVDGIVVDPETNELR
jgi:hypothetical protein